MAYGGIDVHKQQSQMCTCPEAGAILPQRIETHRERCAAVFGARPQVRILLEPTFRIERLIWMHF